LFYIYFVVILSLIVAIHEFGHLISAKALGIKVEAFSVGFGPVIFKATYHNTQYRLSAIPLGGYVKMLGEDPAQKCSSDNSFLAKVWWKRIIVAISGPMFNLVLAMIMLWLSFMVSSSYRDFYPIVGSDSGQFQKGDEILQVSSKKIISWQQVKTDGQEITLKRDKKIITFIGKNEKLVCQIAPVIGNVSVGSPAYSAGLDIGDKIVAIDGQKVTLWMDIGSLIADKSEILCLLERDSKIIQRTIYPTKDPISNRFLIGISPQMVPFESQNYGFFQSIRHAVVSTAKLLEINYYGLYQIFKNPASLSSSIAGPIMISQSAKNFSKNGFSSILRFIAFINVVLFVMNLLPIPILDGGTIIFCLIEGIFGRPIPLKGQRIMQQIGFFLLIWMMFFAFKNDFSKIMLRSDSNKIIGE